MSSSVDVTNKNKDILILGKGQTKELDSTSLTAEMEETIFYSLMPQKYITLKQKVLK